MKENISINELIKNLDAICNSFIGKHNTEENKNKIINKLTNEFNKYVCPDVQALKLIWNPRVEVTSNKGTLRVRYFNVPPAVTWLKPKTKEDIKKECESREWKILE